MSKKRGLSFDDKRSRLLELFHERQDFFQLKELEKIASKEKGIVLQSVKEVLTSLVDDSLVETEKIGTSVYFWSFPSKALTQRQNKLNELKKCIEQLNGKLSAIDEEIGLKQMKEEDAESAERLLKDLSVIEAEIQEYQKKISSHSDFGPGVINELNKKKSAIIEEANKYTDNIFSIKSWCKSKFGVDEAQLNKQFNIPEDMDYF